MELLAPENKQTLISNNEHKLLSINMFMRPIGVKTNASDFKDFRLQRLLHESEKYSIMCFQEMFDVLTFRCGDFLEKIHEKGFKYFC